MSRVKSDLVALGWLRWSGKLLDEVIDAALDLLDVEFRLIHARFELVDASHVGEPLEKHIAEGSRCPLTKTGALDGLHAIADGNDDVEVVVTNIMRLRLARNRPVPSGICKFCIYHFFLKLAFPEDVFDMPGNDRLIATKQLTHLVLGQPNGFSVRLDIHLRLLVRLVNDDLLFHVCLNYTTNQLVFA